MKKSILLLSIFCIALSLIYAQEVDTQRRNMTKVIILKSGNTSLIKAESLKAIWKSTYIHTISISREANLEALIRLKELLQKAPTRYHPDNTLIVCTGKNLDLVEEVAAGYTIVQLPSLETSKSMIVEGKITPLTEEDNHPEYDFIFVEEKDL